MLCGLSWHNMTIYIFIHILSYQSLGSVYIYIYICDIILREFECPISSQQIAS